MSQQHEGLKMMTVFFKIKKLTLTQQGILPQPLLECIRGVVDTFQQWLD
jgi:hypothetical protein